MTKLDLETSFLSLIVSLFLLDLGIEILLPTEAALDNTQIDTMATSEKSPVELEKSTALAHVPRCEEYEKMISGML